MEKLPIEVSATILSCVSDVIFEDLRYYLDTFDVERLEMSSFNQSNNLHSSIIDFILFTSTFDSFSTEIFFRHHFVGQYNVNERH